MKLYIFLTLLLINIFTSTIYASELSCDVILLDDGQSQFPIAATHHYKNTTNDGERVVYVRANQPNPELFRQQQIYSFLLDDPSQVVQVSHDLADGEFIGDYDLLSDNLHVVYQVFSDTFDSQIYIARLDRSETFYVMTIPNNAGWLWIPHFYFDAETQENWIVFHDANYNLWTFDVNSQKLLKLSDDWTMNRELSPIEPIVYYSDDKHNIYTARLDGTEV